MLVDSEIHELASGVLHRGTGVEVTTDSVFQSGSDETIIGYPPAPIAVVSDNGPCFRGKTYQTAFTDTDPLLRHVRTRVRSPQTNGVVERFFGTLKYEFLYRAEIRR